MQCLSTSKSWTKLRRSRWTPCNPPWWRCSAANLSRGKAQKTMTHCRCREPLCRPYLPKPWAASKPQPVPTRSRECLGRVIIPNKIIMRLKDAENNTTSQTPTMRPSGCNTAPKEVEPSDDTATRSRSGPNENHESCKAQMGSECPVVSPSIEQLVARTNHQVAKLSGHPIVH